MGGACPFCSYAEGRFDRSLIVFEDHDVLVVPSYLQKPKHEGHFLVATRAHIPTLYDLPTGLAGPLLLTVAHTARCVKEAFRADGISVRQKPRSGAFEVSGGGGNRTRARFPPRAMTPVPTTMDRKRARVRGPISQSLYKLVPPLGSRPGGRWRATDRPGQPSCDVAPPAMASFGAEPVR